jgi:hypothetical protein
MVEGEFALDTDRLYSEYIYGTSVYYEKVLIFLNPAAISEKLEEDKRKKKT